MNKLRILILSVITATLISCNGNSQNNVEISQQTVELPIFIRLARDNNNRIITMQLPAKICIKNNSSKEKTFLRMYYNYNKTIPTERKGGFGMNLFTYKNDVLSKIKNKKTKIEKQNELNYIIYSAHFIDSLQSLKFNSYIKNNNLLNKDTLHIGTVTEFKIKHKDLFEKLTKNDSISIQFLDGKKLGERVTIPVEW